MLEALAGAVEHGSDLVEQFDKAKAQCDGAADRLREAETELARVLPPRPIGFFNKYGG